MGTSGDALVARGHGRVPAACGSDALLLQDALLMHHVGMAAGSRPGDVLLVGGRWEPAACGRSDALFSRDRSRYQRHGSDA